MKPTSADVAPRYIVLLGSVRDNCLCGVMELLRQRRQPALLIPEAQIHAALKISWELPAVSGSIRFSGCSTAFEEISAVLARLGPTLQANMAETDDASYVRMEWSALLFGFLKSLPCRVINRPRPGAGQRRPENHATAAALQRSGFASPRTWLAPSPEAAGRFIRGHAGSLLYSRAGGGPPMLLDNHPVGGWVTLGYPCRLQAAPQGRWLAVFVIGQVVLGADASPRSLLGSGTELWRQVRLPAGLSRRCAKLARILELGFAVFVVVVDEDGDYILDICDTPDLSRCEPGLRERILNALTETLLDGSLHAADPPREGTW